MFLSTALSILGLGVIVYVLFTLAVYALPFFVAMTVGFYFYESDAGILAAFIAAFLSGAVTLILGQIAFATVRSTPIRLAIGAFYAIPAGVTGFHAIKGLSEIGSAGENWSLAFGSIGALIIGITAWVRITSLSVPDETPPTITTKRGENRTANDGQDIVRDR
ncbi:hypothetical protein [Ruegeria sp. HKCCD8929]|uniref:hypothetical protein n=1 Tax=Ruegeria sp. HKCCD8929 TaxID=2683006 RepID=UPI001489DD86|nr:hypothetical protein [Ruegeria sp. HKCCD8929]